MHFVNVSHSDQILAIVAKNDSNGNQNRSTQFIVWEDIFKLLWPKDSRPSLSPAKVKLRAYIGEPIPVLGVATVNVNYHNQ